MNRTVLLSALVASSAFAHIKLLAPDEWLITDSLGDPQKTGQCGSTVGPESGLVTTVEAGSQLTVRWQEAILHPGHFRIALTDNRATLSDPVQTITGGVCISAEVQNPVVAPVLVDGLFEHTTASPTGTWETTITLPATPCPNCTLQVIQFMAQHGAPCIYYHCANLNIVPAGTLTDAGAGGAGGAGGGSGAMPDGGVDGSALTGGCHCGALDGVALLLSGLVPLLRRRRGERKEPPSLGSTPQ